MWTTTCHRQNLSHHKCSHIPSPTLAVDHLLFSFNLFTNVRYTLLWRISPVESKRAPTQTHVCHVLLSPYDHLVIPPNSSQRSGSPTCSDWLQQVILCEKQISQHCFHVTLGMLWILPRCIFVTGSVIFPSALISRLWHVPSSSFVGLGSLESTAC